MPNILNHITVSFSTISDGEKPLLLVSVRDWVNFETKQRIGTIYEVLSPKLAYEKFAVKVRDTAPVITQEQLEALTNAGNPPMATFSGCTGKLYQDFKSPYREIKISLTAEAIILEESGKK